MDQLNDYSDSRLLEGCLYCGARGETREHVPSRVFLEPPYPENLPVVAACRTCNNGFSIDEEYVACLIEAVLVGTADPSVARRPGIAKAMQRSPALRARIEAAKAIGPSGVSFGIEAERVERVLIKLAMGHAVFDLSQECRTNPVSIWWSPVDLLSAEEVEEFDAPEVMDTFGEVGSRGMQRLRILEIATRSPSGDQMKHQLILNDWVEVQAGLYRYHASDGTGVVRIRMVIAEYLACEVAWEV